MRLLIAVFQTAIIVGVGSALYHVQVAGSWPLIGALILLGSLAFIALGYVIASFAKTEESANGMTSVVQFPLMFLSGTFFPLDAMPDALRTVARVLPLTYLGDGLRQVMVDGTPFSPLWVCFAFLACLARRLLRDRRPLLQVAVAGDRSAVRSPARSAFTSTEAGARSGD